MKYCQYCKRELPTSAYTKDRQNGDGLRARCRECYNTYLREHSRQWPSSSPEARSAKRKRYIQKFHGDRTKKDRDTRYRLANKYQIRIRARTYWAHKDACLCEMPGCSRIGERHHLSYSDPENFVWLCREHHLKEHGQQAQHQGDQQGGL